MVDLIGGALGGGGVPEPEDDQYNKLVANIKTTLQLNEDLESEAAREEKCKGSAAGASTDGLPVVSDL